MSKLHKRLRNRPDRVFGRDRPKVGGLIVEVDGEGAVFAGRFGGLSHVSSPLRWWLVRMRHREGNVLKDQTFYEKLQGVTTKSGGMWDFQFSARGKFMWNG
jgi:hypothetical protein